MEPSSGPHGTLLRTLWNPAQDPVEPCSGPCGPSHLLLLDRTKIRKNPPATQKPSTLSDELHHHGCTFRTVHSLIMQSETQWPGFDFRCCSSIIRDKSRKQCEGDKNCRFVSFLSTEQGRAASAHCMNVFGNRKPYVALQDPSRAHQRAAL